MHNPEKIARACYQASLDTKTLVWIRESVSPSLAMQYDSQVIHGWTYMDGLTWMDFYYTFYYTMGFSGGSVVKNLPANAGDTWV